MPKKKETQKQELAELIEISHFFGGNNEYVIAGGGNTSFKNDTTIWIKASGSSLAEIEEDGFVSLSRELLKKISSKKYSMNPAMRESQVKEDLNRAITSETGKRPSVETSLHEIIDYPFIVHTHPTLVNGLMCSKKAKSQSRKIFGKTALFIEYTDPGYVLFRKIDEELKEYRERFGKEPTIIFLQNHGVFVNAESTKEIKNIYIDIEKSLKSALSIRLPDKKTHPSVEYAKRISSKIASQLEIDPKDIAFRTNDLIQHFLASGKAFEKVSRPFTPDDIVYCKSNYLFLKDETADISEETGKFRERYGYIPKVIGLGGKGLITIETGSQSPNTVMDVFENMMKVSYLSDNFGGPQFMTPEQIDFIDNWEVENYRRSVNQ